MESLIVRVVLIIILVHHVLMDTFFKIANYVCKIALLEPILLKVIALLVVHSVITVQIQDNASLAPLIMYSCQIINVLLNVQVVMGKVQITLVFHVGQVALYAQY